MTKPKTFDERIKTATENSTIPRFYFNAFAVNINLTDVTLILEQNGQPIATINTTHSIGKTLVEILGTLIVNFEDSANIKIRTTKEMEQSVKDETKKKYKESQT